METILTSTKHAKRPNIGNGRKAILTIDSNWLEPKYHNQIVRAKWDNEKLCVVYWLRHTHDQIIPSLGILKVLPDPSACWTMMHNALTLHLGVWIWTGEK